jgi:hypothetical protein
MFVFAVSGVFPLCSRWAIPADEKYMLFRVSGAYSKFYSLLLNNGNFIPPYFWTSLLVVVSFVVVDREYVLFVIFYAWSFLFDVFILQKILSCEVWKEGWFEFWPYFGD